MPTTGRSGYSLEEFIRKVLLLMLRWRSKRRCHARELTSWAAVYNTLHSGGPGPRTLPLQKTRRRGEPGSLALKVSPKTMSTKTKAQKARSRAGPQADPDYTHSRSNTSPLTV